MKDWLTTDLDTYITRHRMTHGLFVFQHIPKTAGSSIVYEMTDHIGNYIPIFIDYTNLPAVGSVDDLMMVSLKQVLADHTPETMRCTSGHLRREHINHIREVRPDARFATFLRDPTDRVISDYRYQCTDQHPPYLEFREKYPRIEDYLGESGAGDKMWHFLIGDNEVPIDQGIAQVEEGFVFVGLKEMYPLSVNIMLRLNGSDAMPKARVRMTKDISENRVKVTPDLREKIREANPRDQALYDHFKKLLLARRDEWRVLTQQVPMAHAASEIAGA